MTHPTTYLKYLPVEGKIKEGCVFTANNKNYFTATKGMIKTYKGNKDSHGNKVWVVERYAVTTEFAVGDKVVNSEGKEGLVCVDVVDDCLIVTTGTNKFCSKDGWFKKLAPISPAVSWKIKDGAVIEIETMNVSENCEDPMFCLRGCHVHDGTCKHPMGEITIKPKLTEEGTIKVKGPCGHFH